MIAKWSLVTPAVPTSSLHCVSQDSTKHGKNQTNKPCKLGISIFWRRRSIDGGLADILWAWISHCSLKERFTANPKLDSNKCNVNRPRIRLQVLMNLLENVIWGKDEHSGFETLFPKKCKQQPIKQSWFSDHSSKKWLGQCPVLGNYINEQRPLCIDEISLDYLRT